MSLEDVSKINLSEIRHHTVIVRVYVRFHIHEVIYHHKSHRDGKWNDSYQVLVRWLLLNVNTATVLQDERVLRRMIIMIA